MGRRYTIIAAAFLVAALALPVGSLGVQASSPNGNPRPLYSVTQYPLPQGSSGPSQVVSDPKGRIWFVEQGSNQVGVFDPASKTFSEFNIPTAESLPEGIAVDPQGSVWFTELASNGLGVLFPGNGTFREITIPPGPDAIGCGPIGVTPQGNGSIWIACEFSNQIDEYVPTLGILRQFDIPIAFSAPLQILFDGAGGFWFPAADSGMLGYATVGQLRPGTTSGIREFAPLNNTYVTTIENVLWPSGRVQTSLAVPSQLAFSQDGGSLWVSEHGAGSFDRYDIGSKTLTKYFTSVPSSGLYAQSLPNGIAVDRSGDVWVAEHYGNRVAEFDPSSGSMVEYPVPCCGSRIAGVLYLTTGSSGTVWFTENLGNAIGELSPVVGSTAVSVSVNPGVVALDSSGSATVTVSLLKEAGVPARPDTVSLGVSGVSRDGRLVNITAAFDPTDLAVSSSAATTSLSLRASGLRPGIYYLTVGAESSSTGVVSSSILVLQVSQGPQFPWIVLALICGAAVIGLVGLFILRRRSGRKRPGMMSNLRRRRPVIPALRQERDKRPSGPS